MQANTTDFPQEVWSRIAEFVLGYQPVFLEAGPVETLLRAEEARSDALAIECAMSKLPPPPGFPNEGDLIPRSRLQFYCGGMDHRDAQHASLYEMLLRVKGGRDQVYPMTVVLEEGDQFVVDPVFEPMSIVDATLQPLDRVAHLFFAQLGLFFPVNPWTYRYLVRPVGDSLGISCLEGESRATIRRHRRMILGIKNYWFLAVIAGQLPNALAQSVSSEAASNKYALLADLLWQKLMSLLTFVLGVMVSLCKCINLDWYRGMPLEAQAVVDMVALGLTLAAIWYFTRSKPLVFVVPKAAKVDRFLGQVLSERGMVYRVRVNGKEYDLAATDERTECHQDEMAMPGSEYFPCRTQPIGAILVTNDGSNIQLFGTFWRMDEYLITARHCSNTLAQSTARVYLASIRQTKKGNYEIDKDSLYRAPDDFFAPEQNVIAAFEIDAFAREVEQGVWASIGLAKAATKVRSAYGQQVHSVGFTKDGLLVSASGKTLQNSGHELLHHTASTQKGFSGSILLCGNSVVGMHVSAAGEHNVAIRVELIQYLIDVGTGLESMSKNRKKYTYADASYKEHYRQHKWRGGVVGLRIMRDGKYAIVLENGEATYGWDKAGLIECFGPSGNTHRDEDFFEDMIMDSRGLKTAPRERYVDFDDERYHRNTFENASIGSGRIRKALKPSAKKGGDKEKEQAFIKTAGFKPIHGPTAPKEQPEAVQVIEDFKEEIKALGYEEGQFAYPNMSPETERKSIEAHLRLFDRRVRNVAEPPKEDEMKRCSSLVAQMMQAASFVPDADYRSEAGVLDVIHSSIIDPKKASGYPYCANGMPTNAQVLGTYGEKGFAQHVLNEWENLDVEAKLFLKGEPTKISKLEKGMPRCITGFPLHVTVKHAAIFKPFMMALTKQWKRTPVKFAFSPGKTGHIEHLASVLPHTVWESDKSTWDYNFLKWIADCCRDTTKMLVLKPPSWSEEQYQQYLSDIDGAFTQVFDKTVYRTSDGHVYKSRYAGIMKSGWFMTIGVNSIAQLVVHVMTLVRLGYSDDQILSYAIVAGGDDVNQEPLSEGVEAYVAEAAKLGVPMEIHQRESLYHSEFFSSDLRMGKEGPEFHPKRWTKHIEHLKVVKRDCLGGALVSHLYNYRHCPEKFALLSKMYHALNEKFPNDFPIEQLVSRQLLIATQYGYEHVDWSC